jgi:hypothetical protein
MIARNGKVAYFESVRFSRSGEGRSNENGRNLRRRLNDQTNYIRRAHVAGRRGQDPLALYLPEFKNLKVGVEKTASETGQRQLAFEAVRREPIIQDLLRHTSGFTSDLFGDSLVKRAAAGKPIEALYVNHISYQVNDYKKVRDFYVDLLGMKVTGDDGKQCRLVLRQ